MVGLKDEGKIFFFSQKNHDIKMQRLHPRVYLAYHYLVLKCLANMSYYCLQTMQEGSMTDEKNSDISVGKQVTYNPSDLSESKQG